MIKKRILGDLMENELYKILICCHKECKLPTDAYYLPVQAGKSIANIDLKIQSDNEISGDECENISFKNMSYCELTVLYWAWKNIDKLFPKLRYIGFCHYRRFFELREKKYFNDTIHKPENLVEKHKIDTKLLEKYLQQGKTIVAKKRVLPYTVGVQYATTHCSSDIKVLEMVIKELYPAYWDTYTKIIKQGNKFSGYNMFIMEINDFKSYCSWLFEILNEVEKRICINHYDTYQKRVFGYMGERLLNVWLSYNNKKIKQVNIVSYDGVDLNRPILLDLIYYLRCNLANFLIKRRK